MMSYIKNLGNQITARLLIPFMKKPIFLPITFIFSLFVTQSCFGEDLITAYNQALQSDPTFKSSEAQWLQNQQLLPISRAVLLPTISSSAGLNRSSIKQNINEQETDFFQNNKQLSLNASQPIFDYASWAGLKNAQALVKQARANYNAARQNLMIRVATAYLAVLQAYDTWVATKAQKESLEKQLSQTRAQYRVGVVPITNVEQVMASYDAIVAQEIGNKVAIADNLEQLRAITGKFYTTVSGIQKNIPLVSPMPANINTWVEIAKKQNYTLQAANYGAIAARENVAVQRAGHFPTITATGGYSYDHESAALSGVSNEPKPNTNRTATMGVNVNLPIFQGGLVTAQTRQASYAYASTSAQTEYTYRNTLTQARESYLAVVSGISQIKADNQSVISNQVSLNSTQAGYLVGNNTIVDVLNQESNLYSAKTAYIVAQYNYLLNILNLKQAAGTLSDADLARINTWLNYKINLSEYNFNNPNNSITSTDSNTAAVYTKPHPAKHARKKA